MSEKNGINNHEGDSSHGEASTTLTPVGEKQSFIASLVQKSLEAEAEFNSHIEKSGIIPNLEAYLQEFKYEQILQGELVTVPWFRLFSDANKEYFIGIYRESFIKKAIIPWATQNGFNVYFPSAIVTGNIPRSDESDFYFIINTKIIQAKKVV